MLEKMPKNDSMFKIKEEIENLTRGFNGGKEEKITEIKVERVVIAYDHKNLMTLRQQIDILKRRNMEILSYEKVTFKPGEEIDPEKMPDSYKRNEHDIL